jgi:hypothetical protein
MQGIFGRVVKWYSGSGVTLLRRDILFVPSFSPPPLLGSLAEYVKNTGSLE